MSSLKSFFLFCSGVYPNLLKRSPSDEQKYVGIGATVFFTGVLAFISAAYAIYTVFDSYLAAIGFGLIWGLTIFNLDRYLVSSMRKTDSKWKDFLGATPRIALAILIAIVISKPLEMKLFDTEIESELVILEQERYKEQEDIARSRFIVEIQTNDNNIAALDMKLDLEEAKVTALLNSAIAEADGTGGSGKRNMGPIYKMKKAEADNAQIKLGVLRDSIGSLMNAEIAIKNDLNNRKEATMEGLKETSLTGFASRLTALNRLGDKYPIILYASLFITLLFIAVECSPILVKLISQRGPYDFALANLEMKFQSKAEIELAESKLKSQVKRDYKIKTWPRQLALTIEAENEIYAELVKKKKEQILSENISWKQVKDQLKTI